VIGIITDRDIAMAAAIRRRNTSHIAVHEAMSPGVRGCLAYDDVAVALSEMAEAGVRRLPVLDATGHLAGIVSVDDVLLRALDVTDGVTATEFVEALRQICSQPSVEPEVDLGDTFLGG
jgi:CBS domain-containing protein